jgi:hypothetical protein
MIHQNVKTKQKENHVTTHLLTLHNRLNGTSYVIISRLRNENYDDAKSEHRYAERCPMFYANTPH